MGGGLGLSWEGAQRPQEAPVCVGGRDSGKSTVGSLSLWAPTTTPAPLTLPGLEPGGVVSKPATQPRSPTSLAAS